MKKIIFPLLLTLSVGVSGIYAQIGKPSETVEKVIVAKPDDAAEKKILSDKVVATMLSVMTDDDLRSVLKKQFAADDEIANKVEQLLLEQIRTDKSISATAGTAMKENIAELKTRVTDSLLEKMLQLMSLDKKSTEYINKEYAADASIEDLREVNKFLESRAGKTFFESLKFSNAGSKTAKDDLAKVEAEVEKFAATSSGRNFLAFFVEKYLDFVSRAADGWEKDLSESVVNEWMETSLKPLIADYINKYLNR